MTKIDDKIFKKLVYDIRDRNTLSNHELIQVLVDKITEISDRVSRIEESLNEEHDTFSNAIKRIKKNHGFGREGMPTQVLIEDHNGELKWVYDKEDEK